MSRIRVLVVDDSVVVRRLVSDTLATDPQIEVVAVAADGRIALTKVEQLAPDLVTMDIEMPVMDGIEAVRALRRAGHRMPIVMFSTLTERGAVATLDALAAGATDYVAKPANVGSLRESLAQVAEELIPRIKALVPRPAGSARGAGPTAPASGAVRRAATPVVLRDRAESTSRPRVVVLGSSTGGPEALSRVVTGLTAPLPVPLVVVQHMPPVFTHQLAARLDRIGPSRVVEATGGEELEAGTVYVAPGGRHLELVACARGARIRVHDGPPVNFCRPAVDVLFRSAAQVLGREVLGVVLTGMGSDGRSGSEAIASAGGTVLVQDEESSVVWGMPGSVAMAGLAHQILPIDEIAGAIARSVAPTPSPASRAGAR
ncbi:chemotaxis response regulator protein-glutamate methylesterase [Actinotalea sp.]|uniref:protein-glutamate methylesterase/protein-glutamine glutaminase n=1 Tax=Actinotalea sp. TaxID=1872145 RepID=UPI0035619210